MPRSRSLCGMARLILLALILLSLLFAGVNAPYAAAAHAPQTMGDCHGGDADGDAPDEAPCCEDGVCRCGCGVLSPLVLTLQPLLRQGRPILLALTASGHPRADAFIPFRPPQAA